MINYVLYQNKNSHSATYGKWYGRAVHQLMEFDEFISHMAQHHCVYSEGTIRGVLIEMECCLREMLLEGKSVKFDDLGIFSLGLENLEGGVVKPSDFNVSKNIVGVRMNLYLGKRFLARELYKDATFSESRLYDVDSSPEPSGETAGGGSASGGQGGNTGGNGGGGDDSPIDDD